MHPLMARFEHVLIPVDLSDADAATFELLREMTGTAGARVTLLHVIEAIDAEPDEELQQFYDSLETKAREKLTAVSQQIAATGMPVDLAIVFGQRVAQIVRFSMERKVDLVVMRSRRVDLSNPGEGWQSVSHQVTILSQVPVLLVK
jgi:nucleotide-binding universal stress UspA family protein